MKFLVVDDDIDTLKLLDKILSKRGTCITVNNGADAIKEFEYAHSVNQPFHLVFLDIMMPGMDGHAVLKSIRSLEENKYPKETRAKIVMLTALVNSKNRFASYEEGCEYYLVKPIIKTEIFDIIEKTKEWFDLLSI